MTARPEIRSRPAAVVQIDVTFHNCSTAVPKTKRELFAELKKLTKGILLLTRQIQAESPEFQIDTDEFGRTITIRARTPESEAGKYSRLIGLIEGHFKPERVQRSSRSILAG